MSRWYPRRRTLSRKPENVQRRLTNRLMKVLAALVIAGALYAWNTWIAPAATPPAATAVQAATAAPSPASGASAAEAVVTAGTSQIESLYASRRSNEIVTVTATVDRVLADDEKGDRHQRFILAMPSGNNVLVAHNIDLAPRVPGLRAGETVTVRGEYEWDERGGVLHWTHHDPAARHQGGWIEFQGRKYE